MLNPMLIGFSVSLAFFSLQRIITQKRFIFSIILGLAVGMAINFHLQSLGLIPLLLLAILFNNFNLHTKLKVFVGTFTGFFLIFSPLIYFDLQHKGAWISSIFSYVTIGQNKFNIPTSWINDLKDFWPQLWGQTITNQPIMGYLFLGLFISSLLISWKHKLQISKPIQIIFLSFLIQVILVHFYKGPRMPVYLIVYHPFFIFLTAWSTWIISKFYKLLGAAVLILVLLVAGFSNWRIVNQNSQAPLLLSIKENLKEGSIKSFRIFSYDASFNISLPLYYLLKKEGRVSADGIKIGACDHYIKRTSDLKDYIDNCPSGNNTVFEKEQYKIFNLENSPLNSGDLFEINSQAVYNWLYSNYPNLI